MGFRILGDSFFKGLWGLRIQNLLGGSFFLLDPFCAGFRILDFCCRVWDFGGFLFKGFRV